MAASRTSEFDPPERQASEPLGNLLRMAYLGFVDQVHAGLTAAGFADVRPAHLTIFQHLDPGGTRISTLARRARISEQSVSALVDYLEQRGYVERRPDPTHRRATLVCLTARGEAEGRACAQVLDALEQALERRLGAEKLRALHATLAEVLAVVGRTASSQV